MTKNTLRNSNEVLAEINGKEASFGVLKEAARTVGKWALIGAVAAGGIIGIGQSDERKGPNDAGKVTGEIAGQDFNTESRPDLSDVKIPDLDGESKSDIVDPATKEAKAYEDSDEFRNGGGMPDLREVEDSQDEGNPESGQPKDNSPSPGPGN